MHQWAIYWDDMSLAYKIRERLNGHNILC